MSEDFLEILEMKSRRQEKRAVGEDVSLEEK